MNRQPSKRSFALCILGVMCSAVFLSNVAAQDKNRSKKKSDQGVEVTIPELGIKIRDGNHSVESKLDQRSREGSCARNGLVGSACQPLTKIIPQVTAVQEKGPAFVAGVAPGDLIISFGRSEYWKNSAYVADYVRRLVEAKELGINLSLHYRIEGSPYAGAIHLRASLGQPVQSGWITEVPVHTGTGKEGRAKLKGFDEALQQSTNQSKLEYERIYDAAMLKIRNNPCQGNPNEILSIENKLKELRVNVKGKDPENIGYASFSVCQDFREGKLTDVERVITAVVYGRVDPCELKQASDLGSRVDDQFRMMTMTKYKYNDTTFMSLRRYLNDEVKVARKECLINLLKSFLIGSSPK